MRDSNRHYKTNSQQRYTVNNLQNMRYMYQHQSNTLLDMRYNQSRKNNPDNVLFQNKQHKQILISNIPKHKMCNLYLKYHMQNKEMYIKYKWLKIANNQPHKKNKLNLMYRPDTKPNTQNRQYCQCYLYGSIQLNKDYKQCSNYKVGIRPQQQCKQYIAPNQLDIDFVSKHYRSQVNTGYIQYIALNRQDKCWKQSDSIQDYRLNIQYYQNRLNNYYYNMCRNYPTDTILQHKTDSWYQN